MLFVKTFKFISYRNQQKRLRNRIVDREHIKKAFKTILIFLRPVNSVKNRFKVLIIADFLLRVNITFFLLFKKSFIV